MRHLITLTMLTTAILLVFGSMAYALTDGAATPSHEQSITVRTAEGESIGTVTNALLDASGNLAFIILSTNVGQGNKEIAVPVGAFTFDPESKVIILSIGSEKLSVAPEFNISDLNDPTFAQRVYRFFGMMPAWTGGEEED